MFLAEKYYCTSSSTFAELCTVIFLTVTVNVLCPCFVSNHRQKQRLESYATTG